MGSSSNRPGSAAFLLALRDTLMKELLLYLSDNQSLLKTVNKWFGEGENAALVGAPDVDNLATAIKILRKRIAEGTATFLVKVKVHQGEQANEGANIPADKVISDPNESSSLEKPCREAGKVNYQDRHLTFNNSVREAIRRETAEK